ncbi:b(0,+)-type amino acid transporter 1 [Neolecta irregularis DAH-3]|uniref:B(0,+)-type amino acid transporter 1 n=1 Tax=Neolecta irregularis (strain DAH-3) TaxID=1198029 RepID=A0A1U7LGG7_NEOID|nr:b(0,+)-type amino acid transporter 1 [Neolecta irregularis DAH-3]|eukprot:OLL21750.1 b(0,+)-type amino acid transporter 1 [Neolecta irregularis DAH-3]
MVNSNKERGSPDFRSLASSSDDSEDFSPSARDSVSSRRLSFHSLTFQDHLIPLSRSTDINSTSIRLEKEKSVSFASGVALVVGLQIGSGIFSSTGFVFLNSGSVGVSLIVWIVAGLLAWTGAASYAELGAAIPLNGGPVAYLHHIFGPLPSFLFSWTAITALKPGGAAIIAIIFAEYLLRLFPPVETNLVKKFIAVTCILFVSGVNAWSPNSGTRTNNVFFVIKILLLLILTGTGVFVAIRGNAVSENFSSNIFQGSSRSFGQYAIALYAGLWAYDGWDNVNYVTAEMKNPSRDLSRVIHISEAIVVVSYVLANISYYIVLPSQTMTTTNTIAIDFGKKVFGEAGGFIFAILVAGSCLGALSSMTFTSSRIVYIAAHEGYLPVRLGILSKRKTPVNALLFNAGIASAIILVCSDFKRLM